MLSPQSTPRLLSAVALAALLTACGGGTDERTGARAFVAQIATQSASSSVPDRRLLAAAPTVRATAVAATTMPTANETLDWAEYKFPTLFPKGPQSFPLDFQGVRYTVRAYSTGNFLGITADGAVFGLGPFTNNVLQGFGNISDYATQIRADACLVNPSSCNPTEAQPLGPLNDCIDPAAATLPTGYRLRATWTLTAPQSSGESTTDTLINGPDTFDGKAAIRSTTTTTTSFTVQGFTSTTTATVQTYQQVIGNGFLRTLGLLSDSETPAFFPGLPPTRTSTRVVFDPASVNVEFSLQPGQSITVTERATVTTTLPVGTPPSTSSSTDTTLFERREQVTAGGRTFNACRYRETSAGSTDVTTVWYIVGRGIPARSESRDAAGTVTSVLELKSATINGVPI